MEKRRWIALIIVPLVTLTGYGSTAAYNIAVNCSLEDEGLSANFLHWRPTPDEIRQALDPIQGEKDRQERFVSLFKQRFRAHNPPMAVGIRFQEENRIQLMCPARMEPWNMDRLALATWKETQADFGHPFDVDIYITFIGSPPVKVGELRPMADNPSAARITYHKTEKEDAEYHPLLLYMRPLRIDYRAFLGPNER